MLCLAGVLGKCEGSPLIIIPKCETQGSIDVVLDCIVGVARIASFGFLSCRVRVPDAIFLLLWWCFSAGDPINHLVKCSFRCLLQSNPWLHTETLAQFSTLVDIDAFIFAFVLSPESKTCLNQGT